MSVRSMWKGAVSFGLVVVPVKLYSASDNHDMAFKMVHAADAGQIRFKRTCEVCGEVVEPGDIAKGYEYGDSEMLVITDAELNALPVPTLKTVDVVAFVDPAEVNPMMFEKSYYVAPDGPAADGPYTLLVAALQQEGRAGVVKITLRQRESTALLRVHEGGLILTLLMWGDELRDPPVPPSKLEPDPAMVTVAAAIMNAMASDFDPAAYTDEYEEAKAALVADKLAGVRPAAPATAAAPAPATNLSDALTASLAALQKPKAAAKTSRPKAGTKAAAEPKRAARTTTRSRKPTPAA